MSDPGSASSIALENVDCTCLIFRSIASPNSRAGKNENNSRSGSILAHWWSERKNEADEPVECASALNKIPKINTITTYGNKTPLNRDNPQLIKTPAVRLMNKNKRTSC